jgi:hypothetical protein
LLRTAHAEIRRADTTRNKSVRTVVIGCAFILLNALILFSAISLLCSSLAGSGVHCLIKLCTTVQHVPESN